MDEQIIELQTRLAFQEESIHQLSQSMQRQQQLIDGLLRELEELRQHLKALSTSPLDADVEEPPPPHY